MVCVHLLKDELFLAYYEVLIWCKLYSLSKLNSLHVGGFNTIRYTEAY